MPDAATDPLAFLLLIIIAALVGGFAFISSIEAWRRWSDNRRMRKLWSSRAKEAKQNREKKARPSEFHRPDARRPPKKWFLVVEKFSFGLPG